MAKITLSQDEFFDFIPLLLLTALKNFEMADPDSPAADLYDDFEKKVLTKLRQYYLAIDPELRRKLKIFLKGIESGQNAVITIRAAHASEKTERKYLTEDWQPIIETAKKYMEATSSCRS